MTATRPAILSEGGYDGEHWRPYTFKWKPDDPLERPGFVSPHPLRLGWQLYEYRFTDLETRRATGAWWERELPGLYAPTMSSQNEL